MTNATHRTAPSRTVKVVCAAAVLMWAVVLLIAGQFETQRLWGLNYLAFLPAAYRWIVLAFAVLAAGVVWSTRSPSTSSQTHRFILTRWPGLLLLTGGVVVLGWLLRSRTALLGDGFMRAADALTIPSPMPSEFLPSAAAMALARYAQSAWQLAEQDALRIVSILAGVILVVGLWYYAPRAGIKRPWTFVFFVLTCGAARLLAGYVESYAFPFAFLVLWSVATLGYMRGRLSAWPAIGFSILAIMSHYAALTIAPATAWALWSTARAQKRNQAPFVVHAVLVLAVGGFLAWDINRQMVAGLGVSAGHFLLPIFAAPPLNYGVLTPAHWIDFVNQWLLLTPALVVAGALWLSLENALPKSDGEPVQRSERIFWLLAIILPLGASLLLDPKLGWARDWDLFTVFFTPALVGCALWLSNLASTPVRRAAAAVALLSLGLWLSFAVDTKAEQARFEALLQLDPERASYGYEILAMLARERNDTLGSIDYYKKSVAVADNNRIRVNIANTYYHLNRLSESLQWYETVLARDSMDASGLYGESLVLDQMGRFQDALLLARKAVALTPEIAERQFNAGSILLKLHQPDQALPYFEAAARLDLTETAYLNMLGGCNFQLGRDSEALDAWERAIKIDPNLGSAYLNAANLQLQKGNFADARRLIDEYGARVPAGQRHPGAAVITDSLAKAGY